MGKCKRCKEEFSDANVFTPAGWRETGISGLCEKCFDEITAEPEEPVKNCSTCKHSGGTVGFKYVCWREDKTKVVNWQVIKECWEAQ